MDRPMIPSTRTRYSRTTSAMATNHKRTEAERYAERNTRTSKLFDWKVLQQMIRVGEANNLAKSPIVHGR